MKKKTKSNLLNIALIGGGLIAANEVLKGTNSSNRSANTTTSEPSTPNTIRGEKGERGTGLSELLATSVALPGDLTTLTVGQTVRSLDNLTTYLVIKKPTTGILINNDVYFKVIHGPDYAGPQGEQGIQGVPGPKGLDGLNAPNWGSSLIRNSSITDGLANTLDLAIIEIVDYHSVYSIAAGKTLGQILSTCEINKRKIYKVESAIKGTSAEIRIAIGSSEGYLGAATGVLFGTRNNDDLKDTIGFYSFNQYSGKINGNLMFLKTTLEGVAEYSRTIFKECELGEPVPSNLSWLPAGQMVYDVTTGEVGRYDGTTVVWFAAA